MQRIYIIRNSEIPPRTSPNYRAYKYNVIREKLRSIKQRDANKLVARTNTRDKYTRKARARSREKSERDYRCAKPCFFLREFDFTGCIARDSKHALPRPIFCCPRMLRSRKHIYHSLFSCVRFSVCLMYPSCNLPSLSLHLGLVFFCFLTEQSARIKESRAASY